jgi:hypothetical protein
MWGTSMTPFQWRKASNSPEEMYNMQIERRNRL